jgi:ferredoxin
MYALELEDAPEVKDRITVVVDEEKGEKELKNRKGKVSRVNPDQCIGCGVCVYKCPSRSLVLERREALEDPPQHPRELGQRVMMEMAAAGKQGNEK